MADFERARDWYLENASVEVAASFTEQDVVRQAHHERIPKIFAPTGIEYGASLSKDLINAPATRLKKFPAMGAPVSHRFRRILLRQFPCSRSYLIKADCIGVLAVAAHRRRPGYWDASQ